MPPALLTADAPGLGSAFGTPQWGLFNQDGSPVIVSDSCAAVQFARDYQISDYQQEQGAFESYNKVQTPFQAKVSFLANQVRSQLLNGLETAVASLNLVTVVTPEISYQSANLYHYDYRRESRRGVTLIYVDVWVEEVRIVGQQTVATTQTGTAAAPTQSTNGASPTQSGQVQPITTAQQAQGTGNLVTGLPAPSTELPALPVPSIGMPGELPDVPTSNV